MAKKQYNQEDLGIINIPNSPFAKFEIPKIPQTRKRAVSVETISDISKLPYRKVIQPGNNRFNFAKDVFLLSFCLIGMNTVDLFNCDCIENGRITYNRTKTKNRRADKAEISIKIEPEIMPLIEKYKDETGEKVFKFHRMYNNPDIFNYAVNKGLKKIGALVGIDDLEFYAARHSWATIAMNVAKVNKYIVHTALNHVDETMKVTDIYIDKDYSLIDEANRKVLDCIKLEINPAGFFAL
jgi:integrase